MMAVLADQFEPVSGWTMRLPLIQRKDRDTQRERRPDAA